MATLSELRSGIATQLANITGLRTNSIVPDTIQPPIAIVEPTSVNYDKTMARGLLVLNFKAPDFLGRPPVRTRQKAIDAYISNTGSSSIKQVLESNRTLGGKCNDLRVTNLSSYGSITIGDTPYLAAEFAVVVYAN